MSFNYTEESFKQLTEYAINFAKKLGATDSSINVSEDIERTITVRMGNVETIETARDLSITASVYIGKKSGHATTCVLHESAVEETVKKAYEIAKLINEDPFSGLPDAEMLCKRPRTLDLYFPWKLSTAKAIEKALVAEEAALNFSNKIRNSDGATISNSESHFFMQNSLGFKGGYPTSGHSISVAPIAQRKKGEVEGMQRDYFYSSKRNPKHLMKPKVVGELAAQRTVARLGAKKIATRECPVVFEPRLAAGLIKSYLRAVSGEPLYQKRSFLLDSLGHRVWAPHITLKEDPFLAEGFGSSPFDHEGVKVKPRILVKKGVVQGYLLSTYTGRKLNLPTTGNRGGAHNIELSSTQMVSGGLNGLLKEMGTGFLVTGLMGQGVNLITGDYSRGAFGYWVEKGEIAYPVEEMTLASNLKDMLANLVLIGDDFEWIGECYTSSLMIRSMVLAGIS